MLIMVGHSRHCSATVMFTSEKEKLPLWCKILNKILEFFLTLSNLNGDKRQNYSLNPITRADSTQAINRTLQVSD